MQNLFFFEGKKTHFVLEMKFNKVVIVGGSNNAEPAAAGGKRGFGGGAPDAEAIFYILFPNNTHF